MSEPMTKERFAEIVAAKAGYNSDAFQAVGDLITEMIRIAEERDAALALLAHVQEAACAYLGRGGSGVELKIDLIEAACNTIGIDRVGR